LVYLIYVAAPVLCCVCVVVHAQKVDSVWDCKQFIQKWQKEMWHFSFCNPLFPSADIPKMLITLVSSRWK